MPLRRRAFTTIELLIVMSIIILLGGILIIAVTAVVRTAKEHSTKVQLENAASLVSEFVNTGTKLNVSSRPSNWSFGNAAVLPPANPVVNPNANLLDFWHTPQVDATGTAVLPLPVLAPNSVAESSLGRDGLEINNVTAPLNSVNSTMVGGVNDAVINTVIAFQRFQSNTAVRTTLAKLPSDKVYQVKNAGILGNGVTVPPILLDAWNNPIIFVPGSGLQTTANGQIVVVTSPDKQPFFASAGPDGDFSHGDDNVYSFEK